MEDLLTYFIYILAALLIAWLLNNCNVDKRVHGTINIYLFLAFLILVLIGTFRDVTVGKDAIEYATLFSSPNHQAASIALDSYYKSEPGFALFVLIISKISNNYTFFFFVISCIEGYAFVRFFKEFNGSSSPYWFIISLFFIDYVYCFSAIRFGLAMAFCMIAFCNYKYNKRIRAFIWIIVGALFHITCLITIVFLLFLLIEKLIFKKHKGMKIIIIEIVCIFVSTSIVSLFSYILSGTRLLTYLQSEGSIWGQIPKLFLAILVLLNDKKLNKSEFELNKTELWAVYFTAFLIPITVVCNISRVLNYFCFLRICAYEITFNKMEEKFQPRSLFRIIIFILMIIWMIFSFYKLKIMSGVVPYKFKQILGV